MQVNLYLMLTKRFVYGLASSLALVAADKALFRTETVHGFFTEPQPTSDAASVRLIGWQSRHVSAFNLPTRVDAQSQRVFERLLAAELKERPQACSVVRVSSRGFVFWPSVIWSEAFVYEFPAAADRVNLHDEAGIRAELPRHVRLGRSSGRVCC